jgi:hypothetical protein
VGVDVVNSSSSTEQYNTMVFKVQNRSWTTSKAASGKSFFIVTLHELVQPFLFIYIDGFGQSSSKVLLEATAAMAKRKTIFQTRMLKPITQSRYYRKVS